MLSLNPPPTPPGGNPVDVVEHAANEVLDGAGEVVDAVTDAVQADGGPTIPAAPGPIPVPYPNVSGLTPAAQHLADFARELASEIPGIVGAGVGAAAGVVSETLARTLPQVIGILASVAGAGGVGARVGDLIGRVAGGVDRIVGMLGPRGGAPQEGQAPAASAAAGLRELQWLVMRDAQWQRAHLADEAARIAARSRLRRAKTTPASPKAGAAEAARVHRMLARLSLVERKLARLQAALVRRGPKFASDVRAVTSLRTSLQTIHRAGGGLP